VVGDVTIQKNTYVGPFVSIRADEGTPFYIGSHSNLQDGVILHGLKNKYFEKNSKKYSIYIGSQVSCAHGALIHGPCRVDDNVFIGFKAIVYNAIIGTGSFISSGAVVTNGVELQPNSFVPPGANVDTQEKANVLATIPKTEEAFAKEVQRVNQEFPAAYSLFFGKTKCSCGLAC
jgi:carbon dioxide concentrating mechanism protein CcmM